MRSFTPNECEELQNDFQYHYIRMAAVEGGSLRIRVVAALLAAVVAVGAWSGRAAVAADQEPPPPQASAGETIPMIEVLSHQWRPDVVWERIGKTKFIWSATVRNNSDNRQRVFVYYDLLDERGVPLARNVFNRFVDPHQTVEIAADSYILSVDLPYVRSSRATAKLGFPN